MQVIGSTLMCPEDAVLYVAAATSFRFDDLQAECLRRPDKAEKLGYDALKAAHVADFRPPWDSKYTININTKMNYWPAENCNLSETHLALMEHLRRMLPNRRQVARDMYGARGWVAHHNTDLWGDCALQDTYLPATYWPMGLPGCACTLRSIISSRGTGLFYPNITR